MCDFKPGDEVVVVRDDSDKPIAAKPLSRGTRAVYVVQRVVMQTFLGKPEFGLQLVGEHSGHSTGAYASTSFRKVQSRDLTAWLETASTFEEPKRKKANA